MATHEAVGSEELSRLLWSAGKCFADGASAFVIKHRSLSEPARSAYSQAGTLCWLSLSNTYPTTAKYILSFNLVIWIVLLALALVLAYHLPWAVLQAWYLVMRNLQQHMSMVAYGQYVSCGAEKRLALNKGESRPRHR